MYGEVRLKVNSGFVAGPEVRLEPVVNQPWLGGEYLSIVDYNVAHDCVAHRHKAENRVRLVWLHGLIFEVLFFLF